MASLIHLNGPTCVGKSTLAARLVETRPLALNLDIDELRVRLGQWSTHNESKGVARQLGFGLAAQHLRAGHDVVLPQLIVRDDVVDDLAQLAADNAAEFHEIVLMAGVDELVARLDGAAEGHVRDVFNRDELRSQIEHSLDALPRLGEQRTFASVVDVSGMDVDGALRAIRARLPQ